MNKKRATLLLIVVCLVLVAGTTTFFLLLQDSPSPTNNVSDSPPDESMTDTNSLKLYRNEEWGFEFQYPEDWEVKENAFGSAVSKFNLVVKPVNAVHFPDPVRVNILPNDWIMQAREKIEARGIDSFEIQINGAVGAGYEYTSEGLPQFDFFFPRGDYWIVIGGKKEYKDVLDDILISFKFLSKAKTYRNEQYGFEYQYPPSFILKEKNFPLYIFADSGEVCKNLFQEESKSRRLLNQTTLADPSTKFKVEVVTVSVYENSDNLLLDDWLNSGAKFLEKHSEECKYDDKNYIEIRLDNKKRLTIDNTPGIEGFAGCCMASNKNIYLVKNNKIYHLSFSGSANVDLKCVPFLYNKYSCPTISEDIFNQILVSFKFLK